MSETEVLEGATGHWSELELRIVDLMLNGLEPEDIWELNPATQRFDCQAVFAAYEEDSEFVEDEIRRLFDERPPARHVRRLLRKMEI